MNRIRTWLAAVTAVSVLAACGGDDDETHNPAPAPKASLRVVHASPDAPAVDVYVDGTRAVTNAPFQAATAFLSVDAGTRGMVVTPTGATTPEVIKASLPLAEGSFTTVVAVGKLAGIEPLVISEDGTAPPAGQLKVRVGHAAPDVGAVDVHVTAPGAALGAPTLSNVAFKGVSAVLTIPAGDYRIRITPTGTTTVVYDSGSVALAAGSDLVILAVAATGGNAPVSLVALTRAAGTPKLDLPDATARLRVVHASPDAPAVDVLVNDVLTLEDVPFPADSGYLTVAPATYNLKVNAANTSTTVIDEPATLAAGKAYTVLAVDTLADIEALVLEDNRTPVAGKARIRVIHASPDAPNVDVKTGSTTLLGNVAFKASGTIEVDAGSYPIDLAVAGTSTVAYSETLTVEAGKVYTVVAVGLAGATPSTLDLKVMVDN